MLRYNLSYWERETFFKDYDKIEAEERAKREQVRLKKEAEELARTGEGSN